MTTLIETIDSRFTSGNNIQVRDIRLTKEEWNIIRPILVSIAYGQQHSADCRINFLDEGSFSISGDGKITSAITNPGRICTCGLEEHKRAINKGESL